MTVTNNYKKIRTLSSILMVDILAVKNFIDDKWEFYTVYEFMPKSDINNYIELKGKRVTDIVSIMQDRAMDEGILVNQLDEIPFETIKFEHDKWQFIRVDRL